MELTLTEFEDLNLYSNKSMEKIIASLINKSSNACLVNMYEDSLILLDHESGQFYVADYEFNREDFTLKLESFDPVILSENANNFEDNVQLFFEEEDISPIDLAESYRTNVIEQEKAIKELINESISKKNFDDLTDYSAIKEIKDNTNIESIGESFIEKYKKRIEEYPLTEFKHFNWNNSMTVSLFETEKQKIVNLSAIEKAKDLWKRDDFKKKFENTCTIFVENVEDGTDLFTELLEEFPQIFYLNEVDRKTLFGKAIINSNELREDMNDILKGITLLFEKYDIKELKDEYLKEQDEEDSNEIDPKKTETESEEKNDSKEKAPELSPDELKKLADDLKKISEKLEDEPTKEKLDKIIEKLEQGMEEGTRPSVVKEAVSILLL